MNGLIFLYKWKRLYTDINFDVVFHYFSGSVDYTVLQ